MRKFLLVFIFSCLLGPAICNAQGIGQIRIQYANPGVNNNLNVIAQVTIPSQPAFRISNSSLISNDTIYLTACYYSGMFTAIAQLTDTFSIGSPPPGITTLHFKIITSASTTQCTQSSSNFMNQAFAISAPLGINQIADKPQILFYPNPAANFISIKNASIRSVILRDLTGKIIRQHNFQDESNVKLDVSTIKNGLYMLEITSKAGQTQFKRIMKE